VTKSSVFFAFCGAALIACAGISCTSLALLVPNPSHGDGKKEKQEPSATPGTPEKEQRENTAEGSNDIDFSLAFAVDLLPETRTAPAAQKGGETADIVTIPTSKIRVAVRQGITGVSLYVMGSFEARSASFEQPVESKGRIAFEMTHGDRIALSLADAPPVEVAVPCTLALRGESALFDFGQESYRGFLVIHGGQKPALVNHINMEEYLRGVLPLEMGKVKKEEIEALKAQAVAARTYACNRMAERSAQRFDVVRTIADQVYGGVTVETPEADAAVAATKGMVLVWRDSLARVYFHSTCGGHTAGMHEVWDRPYCEYLCSVDDNDPQGVPYCSISPQFTWTETWSAEQLSKILRNTYGKAFPGKRFAGRLTSIVIRERLPCGRIQACMFETSGGDQECGGDKVRFVLRRKNAAGYLLRSANFEVIENGPNQFSVEGKGYGHGVGMCQMGAIGRARQGQNWREILKAYYKGVEIGKVTERK
jgi:stage II sporulation protein D